MALVPLRLTNEDGNGNNAGDGDGRDDDCGELGFDEAVGGGVHFDDPGPTTGPPAPSFPIPKSRGLNIELASVGREGGRGFRRDDQAKG